MKKIRLAWLFYLVTVYLSGRDGCLYAGVSVQKETPGGEKDRPALRSSCMPASFADAYAKITEEEVFFIRGEVLEVIHHGNRIKIMEDLKGNFDGDPVFTVWGAGAVSARVDKLADNDVNDTLLVLMKKTDLEENIFCLHCGQYENAEDFMTLGCSPSALKLSGGSVSGILLKAGQKATMRWSELLEILETDGGSSNAHLSGETAYLSQNTPNPANGSTLIKYSLPGGTARAAITVYSTAGSAVEYIPLNVNEKNGTVTLSTSEYASGIYLYTLTANGIILDSKKIIKK
jgi:hypothetical protein